ncbi:MAG: DUF262 domain-containing protein, partial [Sphingobacteriales bacterium]
MLTQNNEVIEEGKRLTLYELLQSESWNIEIPIIQRDYAQGRSDRGSQEVRSTFIETLLEHLQSGENIDLDFIYGSMKESDANIFIPLDGQQRLTTLFLLHWYLAHKEGERDNFLTIFHHDEKSRFTYETRTSSREFCDALVVSGLDIDNLIDDSISETIKDAPWFYLSWQDDPTIQSMLTMLDEIHDKFKDTKDLFGKLLETEEPVITFQFLNLDAFKLTDDLYIKMNARGKQLSPFENFKAKFEQYIRELTFNATKQYFLEHENIRRLVPVHEYFSFKIDTDWANLFWKYKNDTTKVFDEQLMNFLKVMATNYVASKNTTSPSLKLLSSKATLSFKVYKVLGCLVPEFILDLIDSFDLLKNGNDTIKIYLPGSDFVDEDNLFNKVIANNLSYTERIRFYALYQYLLRNGDDGGLNEWMRVVFNLSENTIYNELEEYVIAINSLDKLLQHSTSILKYLSTSTERIAGFLDLQVQEERIKACLLLKDTTWYNKITQLEKHGYFQGQISFLLNFSGIEAFYKQNTHCNWNAQQNQQYFDDLVTYSQKAFALFDDNGLVQFTEFVVERALLSKGDYTLSAKSNQSFLVNISRDISWKRLLRDDNSGKRAFVKMLFEDRTFSHQNVEASLKSIISAASITDWRKHFIEMPEILEYLGTSKYFRKTWDQDIKLLKRERLSGPHVEYYSYAFYLKDLQSKTSSFAPFTSITYNEVSGDYYPWISISYPNAYVFIMIYRKSMPLQYEIKFRQRNGLDLNTKMKLIENF